MAKLHAIFHQMRCLRQLLLLLFLFIHVFSISAQGPLEEPQENRKALSHDHHHNAHEHLGSLPFAEHIAEVALPYIKKSSPLLNKLFPSLKEFRIFLRSHYQQNHHSILAWASKIDFNKTTLLQFLDQLKKSHASSDLENLKQIFVMQSKVPSVGTNRNKEDYVYIERLRNDLMFDILPASATYQIFEKYFQNEPVEERRSLEITVPSAYIFFSKTKYLHLLEIKAIAALYGSQVNYYASIPRKNIFDNDHFIFTRSYLKNPYTQYGLSGDYLHGIDLTGSIMESVHKAIYDEEKIDNAYRNLFGLFQFCAAKNIPCRIHAFEGVDKGEFYNILKLALNSYNKLFNDKKLKNKLKLTIGHINHLSLDWIKYFKTLNGIEFSFDLNLTSNVVLQNSTVPSLLRVIKNLQDHGLTYQMGCDGRGVYHPDVASLAFQRQVLTKFDLPH